VKEGLQKHSLVVAMMLNYYSNICVGKWSSDNMRKLDRDRFRILIEDIRIIDPKARSCRNINELDAVFAVRSQAMFRCVASLPIPMFLVQMCTRKVYEATKAAV
jgi:hypothetical protein